MMIFLTSARRQTRILCVNQIKDAGKSPRKLKGSAMGWRQLVLGGACAIAASWAGATAASADVTVRLLHVEQNQQISGFWTDLGKRYEAAHPGVKVEVQYLENEAYKKKLTTLLQ